MFRRFRITRAKGDPSQSIEPVDAPKQEPLYLTEDMRVKEVDELIRNILGLSDNGQTQYEALMAGKSTTSEPLIKTPAPTTETPAAAEAPKINRSFNNTAGQISLDINGVEIALRENETSLNLQPEQKMDGRQAFAFAKSLLTTPELVKDGVRLDLTDDNGNVIDFSKYSEQDRYNTAMALIAAEESDIYVENANEIKAALANDPKTFRDARKAWMNFSEMNVDKGSTLDESIKSLKEEKAQVQPEIMAKVLNQPIGLMLEGAGVLSPRQMFESGEVQADMVALRNKIEENKRIGGWITGKRPADVAAEMLPKTNRDGSVVKGEVDLEQISKKSPEERAQIRETFGVTHADLEAARDTNATAELTKSNVNEGHSLGVQPIGFIHMALHAGNIPGFGAIKAASLISQRAMDAGASLHRLKTGEADPQVKGDGTPVRPFKLWGDETPEQAAMVQTAERLHNAELMQTGKLKKENNFGLTGNETTEVANGFNTAITTLEEAGRTRLAEKVSVVRDHFGAQLGQSFAPTAGAGGTEGPTSQA